jgi:branched-chain amino acid aminotransferase
MSLLMPCDSVAFFILGVMQLQCINGRMVARDELVLPISNRGFKFGDGVFETMKVENGVLHLAPYHFDRLFTSLQLLQIRTSFSAASLTENILQLCAANGCSGRARVRLAVFRTDTGDGGYCIEALELPEEKVLWNEVGWTIDVYPYARKAMDMFANLKSANYLPYVMADLYAKEKGLDEALVLNSQNLLCDASKANVFLVKEGEIRTPALHQGCVNGVMRRYVVEELKKKGYVVKQAALSQTDLEDADEMFLTNALQGIKWVRRFWNSDYGHEQTKRIHDLLF